MPIKRQKLNKKCKNLKKNMETSLFENDFTYSLILNFINFIINLIENCL